MFPSNSNNINSFQSQSESSLLKFSNTFLLDIENQENLNPNEQNQDDQNLNYKEKSAEMQRIYPAYISNQSNQTKEKKNSVLGKEQSFDEIFDDSSMEQIYQEDYQKEEARISKGNFLSDSFISEFKKGITSYSKELSQTSQTSGPKKFPRLDLKDYEFVKILKQGPHCVICQIRDKHSNEIVVKLYPKEMKEEFLNEACVMSECAYDWKHPEESLQARKEEIFPCFETENYLGLTLQAGLATLKEFKEYLRETKKRLKEAELLALASEVLQLYFHMLRLDLVHRNIKPENIIILPSFRLRLIDFGSARKLSRLKEIKEVVGTKEYLSPGLLQKRPEDPISKKMAIAGDLYAFGLSLLEIAEPNFCLNSEENRENAIKSALEKVGNEYKQFSKIIIHLLDYKQEMNSWKKRRELKEIFEINSEMKGKCLAETFKKFKEFLMKSGQNEKTPLHGDDEEDIKELFEVPQNLFAVPFSRARANCLLVKNDKVTTSSEFILEVAQALYNEDWKKLRGNCEVPSKEIIKGLIEEFHEKMAEKVIPEDLEAPNLLWRDLKNLMILNESFDLETENGLNFQDEIVKYLKGIVQLAFQQEFLSGMKDEIFNHFPCYYQNKGQSFKPTKGPVEKVQPLENNSQIQAEFYLNMFLDICNTKALRIMKILKKNNFLEKLQNFSQLYYKQMTNGPRPRFEKNLDIFILFVRFVDLFSEELKACLKTELAYLQEEAILLSQNLKGLYEVFTSGNDILTLLQYELFYVMIGSYLIYWSAEPTKENHTQDELLTENILLLMRFTDTTRISFVCSPDETHPLENLLGEMQSWKRLQSKNQIIFEHSFKVKVDQEIRKLIGKLYSVNVVCCIRELNNWVRINFDTLNSAKEMLLHLTGTSKTEPLESLKPIEEPPLDLGLESLTLKILYDDFSLAEFEAFVEFIRTQKSLQNLTLRLRINMISDEQIQHLAGSLRDMKELNHVNFDFFNCHFLEEEILQALVRELEKVENLKSIGISVRGCPKVSPTLDLGEHVCFQVEPVIRDSVLYKTFYEQWDLSYAQKEVILLTD